MKKNQKWEPIHPGEILDQEFLAPLEISQYRLAKNIHVPARRINEIVLGKRAVSADTALRLSKYFGTSPKFWLNLQTQYDLDIQEEKITTQLESDIKPFKQAA